MGITTCAKQLALAILLASLLLYHGVGNVHCATVHENNVDLHSLLDFQQRVTNDPNGALSNWSISTHFCRWNGVTCSSTRPWRVTGLNLTTQNLAGQISPSLGNLTYLQTLDLSGNSFHGPLPRVKPLQHLEVLLLGSNLLQRNIPDALTNCSNLAYLDLSMNQLTGSMTKLVGLSFTQNNLTGVIPAALGNITSLRRVYLSDNQLNGRIPDEIWKMTNIVGMDLSINSLSGGISQTLNM
ncbi:hypothetical protein DAI22_02g247000 [Oryza sativa Japonica Group]|nr:hypothetical protein DAI22_02g247000 [Oryza sativa Japonica Group]